LFFVVLLGLFLRLTFIIKPEGLWNDEYVSWMVASVPFEEGFWQAVIKQCHMPLYYLYLKPFTGCSDVILRLTSVVPSVISIFIMYLVGKEYSKKIGLLAGTITSVLSFLIYYAQEVRFYSLLFLFSALSLLFTIRLIKNQNKNNVCGYIFSNLLILFTHVLGIIYLFFNVSYVVYKRVSSIQVTEKGEKFLHIDWKFYWNIVSRNIQSFIGVCGLIICAVVFVISMGLNILNQLPSSQWWGHFTYTNILFLFSDFFSPVLTNNVNAPPVFFYNLNLAIWMTIPTLIAVFSLIKGLKNNKGLTTIALGVVVIMSLLAINGKIVFITKYAMEILPILIILISCGLERLSKMGIILFSIFILFHISYFFTPNYPTKIFRSEGHKIVGEILNFRAPDKVIFTYYEPDRFYRYWNKTNNTYYISKINRFDYRDNPEKILEKIKKGEKVSIIFLDSVSFFPEIYLKEHSQQIPEMFVTFSHIKNILEKFFYNNFSDIHRDTKGAWSVITGTK